MPKASTIKIGPDRSGSSKYSLSHFKKNNTLSILDFINNGDVMSRSELLINNYYLLKVVYLHFHFNIIIYFLTMIINLLLNLPRFHPF